MYTTLTLNLLISLCSLSANIRKGKLNTGQIVFVDVLYDQGFLNVGNSDKLELGKTNCMWA